MTHFPHQQSLRTAAQPTGARAAAKPALMRDVLWGRPMFKAPSLPNPRVALDPLPFTATRVTRRAD